MKSLSILIVILLINLVSFSQMDTTIIFKKFTPKSQFTGTVGTNFQQKMKVQSFGTQMLFPKNAIVPKFGIGYKRHLTQFLSVETGIELSFYRMRFNIEIPAKNFTFDYDYHYHYHNARYNITSYISIPLNFEFNLFERKETLFFAGLGAKLNLIPPYKIRSGGSIGFTNDTDPNNDSLEYLIYQSLMIAPKNNTENKFLTLSAKIGASRYYPKIGVFSINLSLNITPNYISEGVFLFNQDILPLSAGYLTQYNNYIGLDFSYAWVKSKKLKPTRFTIFGK